MIEGRSNHGLQRFNVFGRHGQGAMWHQPYNQRRKTLKNSLKTIISEDKLQELAIDLGQRPEKLALADFVAISDVISAQGT